VARPTISRDHSLSEQEALNAIAYGVAAARSTDVFVNDARGWSLSLSVTNASKAVPANVRAVAFWCASAFRWRLNTAADTTDGAYAGANDVVVISVDPNDTAVVTSVQAILEASTATLYGNWICGT
jgi:hypothetical protein